MNLKAVGLSASLSLLTLLSPLSSHGEVRSFALESHYAVPGGEVAEIVAVAPDGMTLFYTNASGKKVGILDISDPAGPRSIGSLSVKGEPTSAAVSPDGRLLAVAVRNGDDMNSARPGTLALYDISSPEKPAHLGDVALGSGPDSVACTAIGGRTVAVVAIEDEETDGEGDATLGGSRPGRVDVVVINPAEPGSSEVFPVEFPESLLTGIAGVNYPADPQPEFVTIAPGGDEASVSLQENNAVAVLDISDPEKPSIKRIFCAGTTDRKTDLKKDGEVAFSDDFKGRREPDGIAYVSLGGKNHLALANEGDTSLKSFGDGVYPGGRSLSLHDMDGTVLWESGTELDVKASLAGHYPDGRSEKKGIEMEGVASARMFGDDLLIGASERGSFLAVYRVPEAGKAELIRILPTGISPEGVVAVTGRKDGRNLIVSANEGDGTLNVYSVSDKNGKSNPSEPVIVSDSIPWSALSGFSSDGRHLYAVPDNAWQPSRIWRFDMSGLSGGFIRLDGAIAITSGGSPAAYDLEGICWTEEGFWLAAEGKEASGNALVLAGHDGAVREEHPLPKELIDKYGDPGKFGFEGVAASPDGAFVYVALQRGFDHSGENAAILRFSRADGSWETAWYPLDRHSADPEKLWMGLSDLCMVDGKRMLVLERDKGIGDTAEVKRIYSVSLEGFSDGAKLEKTLVRDIREVSGLLLEKTESLCLLDGNLWVAIDNDGAGWTRVIDLGPEK